MRLGRMVSATILLKESMKLVPCLEEFDVLSGREKAITFSPNDSENKLIRVRAESLDATPLYTYSNIVLTELSTTMFLPNVFTPDDDGLNDRFVAKGPKVFNFELEVYSRWGCSDILNH